MRLRMQPLPSCEQENAVVEAARTAEWTPELQAHRASCAVCADAALVAEFLCQEQEQDVKVPDAGLIWWKAEIRRKLELQDQALKPVRWAERAAAVALVAVAGYLVSTGTLVPLLAAATVVAALGSAGSLLFLAGARK